MSIDELKVAVSRLSADELVEFEEWFEEHIADVWDKQFE